MGHAGHLLFESAVAGVAAGLAVVFAAFAIWALWLSRRRRMTVASSCCFLGVVAWWIAIPPSHDRHWRPEVAVMPRAVHRRRPRAHHRRPQLRLPQPERFHGALRRARGVAVALEPARFLCVLLDEGPVGHTFLSFIFDNAPPLSISIETRPEVGEGFEPIASLFKQFELIYVVGDERDLVGVRTNHRRETVYLYRLNTSPENVRRLLTGLPGADQRARRPAGMLSPPEQQLHDQHHALRECRRPGGPVRHPPSPQRPDRQLPLPFGPDRHVAAVRRIAAALPDQRGRAGGRRRARFLASAFAHPCRRSRTDCASH